MDIKIITPFASCPFAPDGTDYFSRIVMWCVCSSDQVFCAFAYTQIRDQHWMNFACFFHSLCDIHLVHSAIWFVCDWSDSNICSMFHCCTRTYAHSPWLTMPPWRYDNVSRSIRSLHSIDFRRFCINIEFSMTVLALYPFLVRSILWKSINFHLVYLKSVEKRI